LSGGETFAEQFVFVVGAKGFEQQRQFGRTEKLVYVWDFFSRSGRYLSDKQPVTKTLSTRPRSFVGVFQNHVHRFGFGIVDESAGVDHDDVAFTLGWCFVFYLFSRWRAIGP
jgi:hypothetical protein